MNEVERRCIQIIAKIISENNGIPVAKMKKLIAKECPFNDLQIKNKGIWSKEMDKCINDYQKLLAWQGKLI